jgi:hypothetical protein
MSDRNWQRGWREHIHKIARQRMLAGLQSATLNDHERRMLARVWASWTRPDPNPPELSELERDVFFRYVDEILQDEWSKRHP